MTAIAMVHTGFNVTNSLVFLPFVGLLAKLVTKMVPDKDGEEVPHLTYLDVRMLDTPALGIVQSRKQILFMAESTELMLKNLSIVLASREIDEPLEHKVFHREEILDNVQKEIVVFLSQLVSGQVPHNVMDEARRQLRMADEYESLSDYITNIIKGLRKMRKNGIDFSEEGRRDIIDLHTRVSAYVERINKAVQTGNAELISVTAFSDGDEITRIMKKYRKEHLNRLASSATSPLNSLVYTDMLNSYRRMKDHALNIAEVLIGEK
jgi:phosphate:Na+ symporter